jgi:hypothetical protein
MTAIDTPANVLPHPNAPAVYMSVADTAKLVRAALKAAFPAVKFTVKSKSYSGGASIRIGWFDGPTTKAVDAVAQKFSGADFDGMQDLKTYHRSTYQGRTVHFGADFIFTDRSFSPAFMTALTEFVCQKYDIPAPEIKVSEHDGHGYIDSSVRLPERIAGIRGAHSLSDLVYQYAGTASGFTAVAS